MSERDMFIEIWKERPHFCTSCHKNLGSTPSAHYFSHIIPKSRRNDLRLSKDNIVLECIECHTLWESASNERKRTMKNFNHKLEYIKDKDYIMYCKLCNL